MAPINLERHVGERLEHQNATVDARPLKPSMMLLTLASAVQLHGRHDQPELNAVPPMRSTVKKKRPAPGKRLADVSGATRSQSPGSEVRIGRKGTPAMDFSFTAGLPRSR
jgi:hypothetical protein